MPVTRYAPSLTGHLHLGHVAHLLWLFGAARVFDARVLLRIEDHDRSRARPEYEDAIRADLDWLGFRFDRDVGRQSDDEAPYRQALERLMRSEHVYPCVCSRKQIAAHSPVGEDGERCYSGRCRGRSLPEPEPHGLRLEIPRGRERFDDLLLGPQAQEPALQCGDLLLRDRARQWTYQFAVAVDDLRQGVDLVVRGTDLLASTGRQILLARLLGRAEPPRFLHHPLILDASGEKLSKRFGAAAIARRREAGEAPESILGEAARRVGLIDSARPLALEDAVARAAGKLR